MYYVLGDSIAKGVILNEVRDRYVLLKESCFALAAEKLGVTFKNLSVFGATIERGKEVFQKRKAELEKGSTIFLEFGGNDCNYHWDEIAENPQGIHSPGTPMKKFKSLYADLIQECIDTGLKPVLINLPPLSSHMFFSYIARKLNGDRILEWMGREERIFEWQEGYHHIVEELAEEFDLPVVDFRKALLSCKNYEDLICADGMHPNAKGHEQLAKAVVQYMS